MDIPETDSEDEMPPGWEERCTVDGLVFYAHHVSKSTQWEHPRTKKKKKVSKDLPFGWERQILPNGSVIFIDHINQKTSSIDPRLAFAIELTESPTEFRQRHDNETSGLQVTHGLDLSEKTAIVTGANSGIGFETARTLALRGCHVVFACRDMSKAEQSMGRIRAEGSYCKCSSFYLDLSSLRSVRQFANQIKKNLGSCDILILNAGVFGVAYTRTEDDLELTFQVNFLSHFYLALLIQSLMTSSKLARIVFVAAESHRFVNLTTDSNILVALCPRKENYLATFAYNNSKLCCILACFEFHRRFGHTGLKCFAVHPGNLVNTELSRHWLPYRLLFSLVSPFAKTMQQACASTVYCSTSSDLNNCSGMYVNNCCPCVPSAEAQDSVLANRLWSTSLELIEQRMGRSAFSID